MGLNQIIQRYWRAFVSWHKQQEATKERERLDQGVRKRQEEASKLGITDMLLDIYRNGYNYQPWISNYQTGSLKKSVTFSVKTKNYTINSEEYDSPFDGKTSVSISLQESARELFRDYITKDCDEFGLTYDINQHGHDIAAYTPGEWVNDLREALDAVAKREKDNSFKVKHSKSAMDDLKNKFGL